MSTKVFEVTIRVEVETPDKTEPTVGDALDIVKYACENVYNKDNGVGTGLVVADTAEESDFDVWDYDTIS